MLAFFSGDGLTRLQRGLERLMYPSTWMEPLLVKGVLIVHDHNRQGLMMGLDIDGRAFAPVKRRRGGPPLLENPTRYRAVNFAVADAVQIDRNTFEIRLSWPDFKTKKGRDVLSLHMKSHGTRPARRAIGIRDSAVKAFLAEGRSYLGREFAELASAANIKTREEQFSGILVGKR